MRRIKLLVEYDGTHYSGWQVQTNKRSIQGTIQQALTQILQEPIRIFGSGRTDSGVHALGQVAHFDTRSHMPLPELLKGANAVLPGDIAIHSMKSVTSRFHAQYNAKAKTYRYTIVNRITAAPLARHHCLHVPYALSVPKMRQAARHLKGKHDFTSFQASDPAKRKNDKNYSAVRTLKSITIRKQKDYIFIEITANGFLYKMVRNIVGTLLEIGSGKFPPSQMETILRAKNRKKAGQTAPPSGLCLCEVMY